MIIRFEQRGDIEKISELNLQVFETEANLVDALS
jgi:predicted N-acetyltransferase YhbS